MLVAFACGTLSSAQPAEAAGHESDARTEVARAEEAVAAASARGALWTTARDALRDARAALAAGDFDTAARAARTATEQAKLGIEQLSYPRFPE